MSSSKTSSTPPEKDQTSPSSFESLCEEAHANAKADRRALKSHMKKLKSIVTSPDEFDRLVLVSDAVTKTADAISKANAQIILLAQLRLKDKPPAVQTPFDEFSRDETEHLLDEIGGSVDPSKEQN